MKSKEIKLNSILKGDCIKKMKELTPKSFQLIITDPPYNISGKSKLAGPRGMEFRHIPSSIKLPNL